METTFTEITIARGTVDVAQNIVRRAKLLGEHSNSTVLAAIAGCNCFLA